MGGVLPPTLWALLKQRLLRLLPTQPYAPLGGAAGFAESAEMKALRHSSLGF